jgi:hypothetical protein
VVSNDTRILSCHLCTLRNSAFLQFLFFSHLLLLRLSHFILSYFCYSCRYIHSHFPFSSCFHFKVSNPKSSPSASQDAAKADVLKNNFVTCLFVCLFVWVSDAVPDFNARTYIASVREQTAQKKTSGRNDDERERRWTQRNVIYTGHVVLLWC